MADPIRIKFLGAARSVTGSKYLIHHSGKHTLVDCGMFQGKKELRLRNWDPFPFPPTQIDQIVLTHAHIDHTGYLPRLIREGYKGPIYCTPSTRELLGIMLPDCGRLQEEDAFFAKKKGFSKHEDPQPLFTEQDAEETLSYLKAIDFGQKHQLMDDLAVKYHPTGHILGAGSIELVIGSTRFWFSGDIGRHDDQIMSAPEGATDADYIFCECTYGDRQHPDIDPEKELERVINETYQRGGSVIIPSFALGRTQMLLYHIYELSLARKIPQMPVYIDSPMAVDASALYCKYHVEKNIRLELKGEQIAWCGTAGGRTRFVHSVSESKAINEIREPIIIISASGMATGGRVIHHLAQRLLDPKNTVLLVGYQAEGTRGQLLLAKVPRIKIHGQQIPVNANVESISGLSAHGDQEDLLKWLSSFRKAPKKIFLTHGEDHGLNGMKEQIALKWGWPTHIPDYLEEVVLE